MRQLKNSQSTNPGQEASAQSELNAISQKREQVINGVKAALAAALTQAAEHFRLLQSEGMQNVLADPQYKEACDALGIMPPGVAAPETNGKTHRRQSNRKGVSFEEAIIRSLADGKARGVDDIYKRVQALKGNDVSRDTMLAVLSVVRKKGGIVNPARGQWQKKMA